jgi:Flp pilus assembly protein TadD
VVVSVAYIVVRSLVLGSVAPQTSAISLSPWEYVLTASSLLGRLLRAQLLPTELNFWHVFRPVQSLWTSAAVLAFLTVGIWVVLLFLAVRRRALVPTVALAAAVLPLTPTLLLGSLNQGLENAFAERYVYLPSFGAVLLAGWAVAALDSRHVRLARPLSAGFLALAVLGAAVTLQRNPVWRDSLSLWSDAAAKSPGSGVANLYYGFALMGAGQVEPGQRHVQRAVTLSPELVEREMRRAISYAQAGRSKDAVLAFHRVLVMDPRSAQAHFNLGVLYEARGETPAAVKEYLAAIEFDPASADAHNNVGILLFTAGYREQALQHLEKAARLQPKDPAFRANLERARAR